METSGRKAIPGDEFLCYHPAQIKEYSPFTPTGSAYNAKQPQIFYCDEILAKANRSPCRCPGQFLFRCYGP